MDFAPTYFLMLVFCGLCFALLWVSDNTYILLLKGVVFAIVGTLFGFDLTRFGDYFGDLQAEFFGHGLVVFSSVVGGGLVSLALSELRDRKRRGPLKNN